VRTTDGRQVAGELVLVDVAAVPDVKLACRAGRVISPSGGVPWQLRTSARGIFAAGDMCEYDNAVHRRLLGVPA
jgi:3-phenylpropionate/trans-cinnamate dioxygenase ferredoxin reductase subunit